MNETNKIKDQWGSYAQAYETSSGEIVISTFGGPEFSPDQAIKFFEQGLALAKEAKAKQ